MKHLHLRFALLTVLLSFALSSVSAYDFKVDGLRYSITSLTDLTCCLESVEDSISGELVIPEKVKYLTKELTVTSFLGLSGANITSVVIPRSIISIPTNAFSGCTKLQSVVLYNGITSIGEYAFSGCTKLSAISIPSSVKCIYKGAFDDCFELKKVVIEDGVEDLEIGVSSKYRYESANRNYFYCGAFAYSCIDDLYVGRNTKIYNPEANKTHFYVPTSPFGNCTFKKVVIGDNCTRMPVFEGVYGAPVDTYVDTVFVGRGITYIPSCAFQGCKELSFVDMRNSPIVGISSSAFSGTGLKELELPNTVLGIGEKAFSSCSQLKQINIGKSVEQIGKGAFAGCSQLEQINIGESVKHIGIRAFSGCEHLQTIELPQSLISIGDECFSNCTSLKEIELPSKISCLNSKTFSGCSNLTTITIGEPFISFGKDALLGCENIERINCKCITPPSFVNQFFTIKQYTETIMVCVPKGTLESYQSADIWMNFWNLQEDYELTKINEVTAKKQNSNLLFDLQGRKLSAPQKGINIVNGKKILVK